jgi:Tol biopolymer transport system component
MFDRFGMGKETRMSSHHRRSLALALLALALAGCAAGPESTDATTTPRTAPSEPTTSVTQPTPSVTPPPTAVDVPSFVDLRTGETTPLPDGMPTTGRAYAVSPDGTMVASSPCCHAPNPVWVANIDGTGVREITPDGIDGFVPRWSPDGSMLVYQERGADTQELGTLVVVDVATGERTVVTDLKPKRVDSFWWVNPTFTPDGEAILFSLPRGSEADAPWDLWSVPAAGGEPTLVLRDAADGAYSPDGRSLSYVPLAGEDVPRPGGLLIADADGTDPRVLVEGDAGLARWSPDGTRITYEDDEGVHVVDVATGETSLVARGDWPEWFDNDTLIVSAA